MKTIIHNQNFSADQKLKDYISDRINKLDRYFDRVTAADVFLKLDNKNSSIKDKVVEIKLNVPRNQIFVTGTSKTFEKSFDEALSIAQRQLNKYKEQLRGK